MTTTDYTTVGWATCDHDNSGGNLTDPLARARWILDPSRFNLPLISKTRVYVRAHPDQHNQNIWAVRGKSYYECGTAMCFAGWAVHFTGHEFDWESRAAGESADTLVDGRTIPAVAREELGLTREEGTALFGVCDTVDALDWMIEHITDGALPATDPTYLPRAAVQEAWGWVQAERADAQELVDANGGNGGN